MAIKAVEVIFKLKDLFSTQVTKVTSSFKKTEKASKQSADAITRNNRRSAKSFGIIGQGITSVTTKLLAFASATLAFVGFKRGLEGVLSTGAEFESLAVQMEAVTGSAEKGEKAFSWVKDFTRETPFQLNQVAEGFVKLKAFGLDPMNGSMQAIVDQAAKLGGSQETLNGIILAVGQAWAKQKLQGEEILQLVERGVPVWELLQKATGKNVQELQKLSAAGKLGRTEISLLIKEIGKSSSGAAAKAMATMTGLVSNLRDEWAEFKNTVAEAGVFEFAKDQIELLRNKISEMAKNGELKTLASDISNAMIGIAEGFKSTVKFIVDYSTQLKVAIGVMVAMKVAAFAQAIVGVGTAFIAAARGVRIFKVALISTGIGAIVVVLGELAAATYEWLTASKKTVDLNTKVTKTYGDLAKAQREKTEALRLEEKAQKEVDRITKEAYKTGQKQLEQTEKTGGAYRRQAEEMVAAALRGESVTKASTDNQIKALKKYEDALEKAQQKTREVSEDYQQLIIDMQGGTEKDAKDLNTIDFAESITNARQALNEGDFDGAIQGAEATASMLRKMKEAGAESSIVLTGLAQQLKRVAEAAAKGKEIESKDAVNLLKESDQVQQPINTILEVDISKAQQQIEKLREEASKPIVTTIKTIYTNERGNSANDTNRGTAATFRDEALKKGSRT